MRLTRALGLVAFATVSLVACDEELVQPVRERYVVPLLGANERPTPVTTTATGSALVDVFADSIVWFVDVNGIDSVTAGHFHAADANSAGPVMHFVFSGPTTGRAFSGLLNRGVVTRSSTFSTVFTYDSLLTRIRAGTAYLNVHTRRNLPGELRGQVVK